MMRTSEKKVEKVIRAGDSAQITRDYFDSLLIEMRHLDGVLPSTKLELFGKTFDTPIMMAAFSHLDKFKICEDGMFEIARAAAAANAVNFAGMGSEEELERIIGTGAATVKIIKPYVDNERILRKIEHAERAGALAVGMDIDHSFNRRGEYDNVLGEEMSPKTVDEIKMLVKATKLPFIVKGVLSVTDAIKCAEAGVKGIVVSHHHGIIDYAIPPLMILPEIVRAVGSKMKIFVDCGIESGYDVFKAIALGADAACVGRAILGPLGDGCADAACKWIEAETAVLAGIMARTGSATLKSIDASLLHKKQF